MTEMNRDNPAAEHPADALAAMAAGEDEAAEQLEPAEATSGAPDGPADGDGADGPAAELPTAVAAATTGPGQARRAQSAAAAARARQANADAYKKMAVPFLAVVAALLMVVAVMTTVLILRDGSAPGSTVHMLKILVMVMSYPLSAILAFGAWWFHRQTRS